jgi:hypothetical protein
MAYNSPRTWNKSGAAAAGAVTLTVGSAASPFGPGTITVANTGATNPLWFSFCWGSEAVSPIAPATATDDGNSFMVDKGKEYSINLDTQNSVNQLQISIMSTAGTNYIINAIQAY